MKWDVTMINLLNKKKNMLCRFVMVNNKQKKAN